LCLWNSNRTCLDFPVEFGMIIITIRFAVKFQLFFLQWILEVFVPKGFYFLFFHKICLFFVGLPQKKVFCCCFSLIFYAVFNIVKTNFISNFSHGTPYSTTDFNSQEFQTNRSVTVKVRTLLFRCKAAVSHWKAGRVNSLTSITTPDRVVFKQLCQQRKFIQIAK